MKFKFDIRWLIDTVEDEELDPRLLILLREIRERGSLRKAADVSGVSYRFAWELIRIWQERVGMPLVLFKRGRGASLTELGDKLLWAEQIISSRLRQELNELGEELNDELQLLMQEESRERKLRVHVSHDLAISYFENLCHKSRHLDVDFQVRGSLDGLRQLAAGHCDIAGFHFPRGELSGALASEYRPWLLEDKMKLVQVAVRQQGLMVQKENPRHVRALDDLNRRSIRFINRQKGSGTRVIFDELLIHADIDKKTIKGYFDEEFTHLAVAAMITSGVADVAFGIKAAASQFGLHFIPLVEESYVLAIGRKVTGKTISSLQRLLRSETFNKKIKSLPGYIGTNTGKIVSIEKLLQGK